MRFGRLRVVAEGVRVELARAYVVAHPYVERDRPLVPGDPIDLGVTPVRERSLPPGSYLVVLRPPGFRDVRYPVLLRRAEHHENTVRCDAALFAARNR